MDLTKVLYQAFLKLYHEDLANAATHCSAVRYSPLTFRLAEAISEQVEALEVQGAQAKVTSSVYADVWAVLVDKGTYAEDAGR